MSRLSYIFKVGTLILVLGIIAPPPTLSFSGKLMDAWARERDLSIHKLLYLWFKEQKPLSELKPIAQRIAEYEGFIVIKCGADTSCYEKYSLLYGKYFTPQNLPVVLMEVLYGIELDPAPHFLGKRFDRE